PSRTAAGWLRRRTARGTPCSPRSPPRSAPAPHRAAARSPPSRRGPAAFDRSLARLRDLPHVSDRPAASPRSIDRCRIEIDAWIAAQPRTGFRPAILMPHNAAPRLLATEALLQLCELVFDPVRLRLGALARVAL